MVTVFVGALPCWTACSRRPSRSRHFIRADQTAHPLDAHSDWQALALVGLARTDHRIRRHLYGSLGMPRLLWIPRNLCCAAGPHHRIRTGADHSLGMP